MKENTLKSPFVISIIFHSVVILSIPFLYQPPRQVLLDITPIQVLQIAKEEKPLPQAVEEPKKEEPKKIVKTLPSVPQREEKKKEVKNEPQKIEEPMPVHETVSNKLPELPAPIAPETKDTGSSSSITVANPLTEAKAETKGSKYGLEGGKGSGNADEMSLFKTMVRTKIERAKFYPRWARQRGYEGVVGVKFTIQPDGSVKDVNVVKPCHCDVLNKAACEAIMKAAPFNPRPKELEGKEMAMEIDISYKLE